MSISLVVTERNGERLVPIATEEVFSRYWEPLAARLKLKWLPLFQSGFFVDKPDIPFVINDLKMAREHLLLQKSAVLPEGVLEQVEMRMAKLISELEELQKNNVIEAYIG